MGHERIPQSEDPGILTKRIARFLERDKEDGPFLLPEEHYKRGILLTGFINESFDRLPARNLDEIAQRDLIVLITGEAALLHFLLGYTYEHTTLKKEVKQLSWRMMCLSLANANFIVAKKFFDIWRSPEKAARGMQISIVAHELSRVYTRFISDAMSRR